MKKVLGFLLVLCVVVGVFSGTASAATTGTCGDNVAWALSDDGILTISGTGPMTNYSYTSYAPWHGNRSSIKCVVVEKGVTSIGNYSFYNCDSLTTVTLPATLKTIGSYAFYSTAVNGIQLPEGLTSIGEGAFCNCDFLTAIAFPATLTAIGSYCFSDCDGLTGVTIPATITNIGSYAFYECRKLAELKLLSNRKVTLGESAFGNCFALRTVALPVDYDISGNPFNGTSGVTTIHYTYGASGKMTDRTASPGYAGYYVKTLEHASRDSIQSIDFEEGITHIGSYLYYGGSSSLTTVTLPSTLKTIGSYAFYSTAVNGIQLPEGLTSIGEGAFCNCDFLTAIEFPATLTAIGSYCFSNCDRLTSVTIPATITSIDSYAFYECAKLAELKLLSNSKVTLGESAFGNCFGLRTVTLPVDYDISSNPFNGTSGVTAIHYTYGASGKMTDRTASPGHADYYPKTLEHASRDSIQSIDFEEGITHIGNYAFYSCTSLIDVRFRGNAPKFGDYIFNSNSAEPYMIYYPLGDSTWPVASLDSAYNIQWVGYSPSVNINSIVSSRTNEDFLILYPVDMNSFWTDLAKNKAVLSNVTISSSLGEETVPKGGYVLGLPDAKAQRIVLTRDGYRDYVLPTAVTETLVSKGCTLYSLTAYMQKDQKDGKPYISTVFGRIAGSGDPYVDLQVTKLEFTEKDKLDVIISARGFEGRSVTYYIAQDQARKISNTTGVFSSADLYDLFDDTSTVYVYAKDSSGRLTQPMEIKLSRTEEVDVEHELFWDSEWSILGKDYLKIKLSDSIPLLGGTEIDLSAFSFPIGYERTDNTVKISLGFDLFSRTEDRDGCEWKNFKELLVKNTLYDPEVFETFCNSYKLAKGKSWKDVNKANKFNIDVVGYIEGMYVNGKFVVKEGMITFGGKFTFQYVAQGAVWVIPVYGAIEAGADLHFGGVLTRYIPDKAFPFEASFVLTAEPKVEGKAGVGIKGMVSGGLYAEGKLPIRLEFQKEHLTIDLKGEIGVEGEFFILHGKKPLLEGETSLIDWYYGDEATAVCLQDFDVRTTSANAATVVSRDYAAKTSGWLGRKKPGAVYYANGADALAVTDVDFQDLQTSIFANSQPQLVNVGERMLLVWVEDDANRDTYNRMRLVYSLYDPTTAAWSEPQPVWDDGHNDGYPRMASDGNNAYVLWQKINMTLDENNTTTVDATLENSELCLARFDAASGTFVEAQMITSNALYEYAHNVVVADGAPVVYWADAADNALNTPSSSRLNRWSNGTTETIAQNLNYILSINAAGAELTYVMDTNGDLSTTEDVTAFTISGTVTTVFDNSEMGAAMTYASYAPLDGKQTLFLSDMNNIYYAQNGEVKAVLEAPRIISGNLAMVQTLLGTTAVWTEQVNGWNELYAVSYENGTWTEPVQVSEYGELLSQISLISYSGKLTGVCNANAVTYDETTGEYTKGQTDLVLFKLWDFADIKLNSYVSISEEKLDLGTDTELYVTVHNNGTLPVSQITFTVADTLGTESVQTVAVTIPSGGSELVTLTYPVPENYNTTTLTITAAIEDTDADESDNRVSVTIGQQDLSVTETAVEMLDGGYSLKAVVENGSLVDAQNVTMSVSVGQVDAEVLQTLTIGTINRANYALAEVLLKNDVLTFDENGIAKVYLRLSADGNESVSSDNSVCIIVTQNQQTTCMHPETQTVEALAATCLEPGYEAYEICVACGEHTTAMVEIPATGHSFVDGVCTACGEENTDYVATPTLTGKSFSLSFEDKILVNFYYTVSDRTDVAEQGMLVFYADPGAADIAKADDIYTGSATDGTVFMNTTDGIAAKYMGDSRYYCAYAKLTNGTYAYSPLYQYSPKKYATNKLASASSSADMKALCVAMLNYGAAAQSYFGYKTDDLMNAALTEEQQALVVAYDSTLFKGTVAADASKIGNFTQTSTGFSARSASVSFEGAFAINYYFTPSATVVDDLTLYYWTPEAYAAAEVLTEDNASGSSAMVNSNGTYWGQVSGIAAKKLDDTYYVAGVYTDAAGNTYCTGVIAYSLSKYCMNNAKPGKTMQELASATAMYGYYAKVYFN